LIFSCIIAVFSDILLWYFSVSQFFALIIPSTIGYTELRYFRIFYQCISPSYNFSY